MTFALFFNTINAQVGVNTTSPKSTMDINGSFSSNIKEISANYTITDSDFYIVYNNTSDSKPVITLPAINSSSIFKGRIYQVKNASPYSIDIKVSATATEKMRVGNSIGVDTFTLTPGSYTEIVQTGNSTNIVWDVMYISNPSPAVANNVDIKTSQLAIPPLTTPTGWTIASFNTSNVLTDVNGERWTLISKTDIPFNRYTDSYLGNPFMIGYDLSTIDLEYEYSGTALSATDLLSVKPILTTANNTSIYPDVFTASLYSITNTATVPAKTRIKFKVTRVDKIAYQVETTSSNTSSSGENSNWTGTFIINLILAINK